MADTEVKLTEFEVDMTLGVPFDAKDIVRGLTPLQIIELINEIDDEVGLAAFTVLLMRDMVARGAPLEREEFSGLTTEQLEDLLSKKSEAA